MRTDNVAFGPRTLGNRIIGAAFGAACIFAAMTSVAAAETRTLDLYNIHTKERLTITFKKDGRYIPSALAELNRFLRDWRRNEVIKMDPRLFDAVWEVYQKTGARQPLHVVCGYRSLATNNMLRSRSSAVAEHSQHTLGRAMDLNIPGVSVNTIRAIGIKLQNGGVGWYPNANSPFVHIDVGNVRAWPRMTRTQLVSLFPDGKTAHIPADGKPLPGYQQALAEIQKKRGGQSTTMMADSGSGKRSGGLLAMLFGGNEDDSAEIGAADDDSVPVSAKPAKPAAPVAVAAAPQVNTPAPAIAAAPAAAPAAQPVLVAAFAPRPLPAPERPQQNVTSLADATLPASAAQSVPFQMASADIPPLPLARPDSLGDADVATTVALAVPPVLPPQKPDMPEVTLASAEAPAPRPLVNPRNDAIAAQMALAEVAHDTAPAPEAQSPATALSFADPVAAPKPAPVKPRLPVQMASLTGPAAAPQPLVRGLDAGGPASLSALADSKADMFGGNIEAPLATSDGSPSLLDGSQSVYWGAFARLAHPNQRNLAPLFAAPVMVASASFGARPYGDMTATHFAGKVTPPNDIVEFLPDNQFASR
ncbi:DUF882 domain-containing protein [Oryzibacter oryziterrae]|uniref:DUF882 domain-containing protein n=1 Tax=Oryzibacter oryziterrae TaxID=2766474 RepID=UPI001F1AFD14|nr:DUF882 domain-containing protein [Oryzibacter oryziterrae]